MDVQLDFSTEISKYGNRIRKEITINNCSKILSLTQYSNSKACDVINDWMESLSMMNKTSLFKNKYIMRIIYALLTGYHVINLINSEQVPLDIYDENTERFIIVETITNKDTEIKLKLCSTMIIFDCTDLNDYKIYELYNINLVKQYYNNNKVSFNDIIKDINLIPIYKGSVNNLEADINIMSPLNNHFYKKYTLKLMISSSKIQRRLERKIVKRSSRIFNSMIPSKEVCS